MVYNFYMAFINGFVGLNGAGKTTTIRMILNMIKPTFGSVSLLGEDVSSHFSLWHKMGYIRESVSAYDNLTVYENPEVVSRLRSLKGTSAIGCVTEKLRVGKYRNIKAGNLSLGNRQRPGPAKTLIHEPEVLFLDESMNEFDPSGIYVSCFYRRALLKAGLRQCLSWCFSLFDFGKFTP